MILVQGWVRLAPGEIDRLRPAAVAMADATKSKEPGCLEYAFAVDVVDPDLLRITERWIDQAALDAHFATAHMAAFNQAMSGAKIVGASVKAYDGREIRTLAGT